MDKFSSMKIRFTRQAFAFASQLCENTPGKLVYWDGDECCTEHRQGLLRVQYVSDPQRWEHCWFLGLGRWTLFGAVEHYHHDDNYTNFKALWGSCTVVYPRDFSIDEKMVFSPEDAAEYAAWEEELFPEPF